MNYSIDRNECQQEYSNWYDETVCGTRDSGNCVNTPGSYRCVCNEGYTLDSNSRQCNGKQLH